MFVDLLHFLAWKLAFSDKNNQHNIVLLASGFRKLLKIYVLLRLHLPGLQEPRQF